MSRIARKLVDAGGCNLFTLDSETAGTPIICLHGRWGRAETWIDFIEHYAPQFRVIAPDQRGHGLSDKPIASYTVEEMAADIVCLAKALGLKQFIVVGHSMGGGIAAHIAAHHPEGVLGLAILDKSPDGPVRREVRLEDIEAADPVTRTWPLPFASLAQAQAFLRQELGDGLSYDYFMSSLAERVEGYGMLFGAQAISANIANYHSWYELLAQIECPTMIARSSSHEAVSDADFEILRKEIRQAYAYEVSHPDHNIHLSNKAEFYAFFDDYLHKSGLH